MAQKGVPVMRWLPALVLVVYAAQKSATELGVGASPVDELVVKANIINERLLDALGESPVDQAIENAEGVIEKIADKESPNHARCKSLHSCGHETWVKNPAADATMCKSRKCDEVTDRKSCCVQKALCSTLKSCGHESYVPKLDARTEFCSDRSCHAEADRGKCCMLREECAASICPKGTHVLKDTMEFGILRCTGAKCSQKTDMDTCCESTASCVPEICPIGSFSAKPWAKGSTPKRCQGTKCTRHDVATCCDEHQRCSQFFNSDAQCGADWTQGGAMTKLDTTKKAAYCFALKCSAEEDKVNCCKVMSSEDLVTMGMPAREAFKEVTLNAEKSSFSNCHSLFSNNAFLAWLSMRTAPELGKASKEYEEATNEVFKLQRILEGALEQLSQAKGVNQQFDQIKQKFSFIQTRSDTNFYIVKALELSQEAVRGLKIESDITACGIDNTIANDKAKLALAKARVATIWDKIQRLRPGLKNYHDSQIVTAEGGRFDCARMEGTTIEIGFACTNLHPNGSMYTCKGRVSNPQAADSNNEVMVRTPVPGGKPSQSLGESITQQKMCGAFTGATICRYKEPTGKCKIRSNPVYCKTPSTCVCGDPPLLQQQSYSSDGKAAQVCSVAQIEKNVNDMREQKLQECRDKKAFTEEKETETSESDAAERGERVLGDSTHQLLGDSTSECAPRVVSGSIQIGPMPKLNQPVWFDRDYQFKAFALGMDTPPHYTDYVKTTVGSRQKAYSFVVNKISTVMVIAETKLATPTLHGWTQCSGSVNYNVKTTIYTPGMTGAMDWCRKKNFNAGQTVSVPAVPGKAGKQATFVVRREGCLTCGSLAGTSAPKPEPPGAKDMQSRQLKVVHFPKPMGSVWNDRAYRFKHLDKKFSNPAVFQVLPAVTERNKGYRFTVQADADVYVLGSNVLGGLVLPGWNRCDPGCTAYSLYNPDWGAWSDSFNIVPQQCRTKEFKKGNVVTVTTKNAHLTVSSGAVLTDTSIAFVKNKYSCGGGWSLKKGAKDTKCSQASQDAGSCTMDRDQQLCCVRNALCQTMTKCGSDPTQIVDPGKRGQPCAGIKCDAFIDKKTCCKPKAKCSSMQCGLGYPNLNNANEFCSGPVCQSKDRARCCMECPDWTGCASKCAAARVLDTKRWSSGRLASLCIRAAEQSKNAKERYNTFLKDVSCTPCKGAHKCKDTTAEYDCTVSKFCKAGVLLDSAPDARDVHLQCIMI